MKHFDLATRKKVIDGIRQGATLSIAAGYSGVGVQRLRNWLKRGEAEVNRLESSDVATPITEEHDYAQFFLDYRQAESELAATLIGSITKNRAWRAKAWALERRFRDDYGREIADISDDAGDWWKAVEESEFNAVEVEVAV